MEAETGTLHHVELWVPDLERGKAQWGWLLGELGYEQFQDWSNGRSWRRGATYLVIEQSPAMSAPEHDRLRPGLNHLAFHAGARQRVDALTASAPSHGWTLLFTDRHPYAGGEDHYAAYLANTDSYEVELIADADSELRSLEHVKAPEGTDSQADSAGSIAAAHFRNKSRSQGECQPLSSGHIWTLCLAASKTSRASTSA